MKFRGYTLNTTFLKCVGLVLILIILAVFVGPWFIVPALVIVGGAVVVALMLWAYQKWQSP